MTHDRTIVGPTPFEQRIMPLSDIEILRAEQGGDGRTVRAYAAVYERPVVVEEYGEEFEEIIRAGAFRKTIAERRLNFQVLYNHARTLQGTPAERYAMPLGVPLEVAEDARGVLTVTRYAKTDLADEILALINEGAIRGMSFSGVWVQSRLIRATKPGQLDRVERLEVAMREYGPTPFPVYETAKIVSVRASDLAAQITALPAEEGASLLAEISGTSGTAAQSTVPGEPPDQTGTPDPIAPEGASVPAGPPVDLLARSAANRRRRQST